MEHPVQTPTIASNVSNVRRTESAEMIRELHSAFAASGDVDCLDNAIELARELAGSDKNTSPLLKKLLELRNSQITDQEHTNQIQV